MSSTDVGSTPGNQRTFLGHPVGLYVLFLTEMWERFSYYGMRGLLTLYMINYFKWSQTEASFHYKWYTSLVYLTPLLGGYLADRYLGNKRAVIIGATLMAFGHFLMAFEAIQAFYAALIFLILGNGFFKPNMTTQVGRLYGPNDPRRDGAYTIFYMGINLGAFLSPLVCGWLAENTIGGYHSGFAAAGIGMVFGLVVYLVGQPFVREVVNSANDSTASDAAEAGDEKSGALSEAQAEETASVTPALNRAAPLLLMVFGFALAISAPALHKLEFVELDNFVVLEIAAFCALIASWIVSRTHQAARDRVLAIYLLGIFLVCFWAAFEQAGNVLTLWADKYTDRVMTGKSPPPALYPDVSEISEDAVENPKGALSKVLTMFQMKASDTTKPKASAVIPTSWFQSINALAIFVIAPFFAVMWTALERRGRNPSVPTKMAFGVVLMALSLAVMTGAAKEENRPTQMQSKSDKLPEALATNPQSQVCARLKDKKGQYTEGLEQPYHSGRLTFDDKTRTFHLLGVLPDVERDQIVRATAPAEFVELVKQLQKDSDEASDSVAGRKFPVSVQLPHEPPGFDMRYAGIPKSKLEYDPATHTLTAKKRLQDKDVKALLVAAGDPLLRANLDEMMLTSSAYRVSPWWLFWSYILATIGELCLSPVGLSMVSKLAPARFATMLMGMWMLMSFFGNFVSGAMGEIWETKTPTDFFSLFVVGLGIASVILFILARRIASMMHGVN